MDADGGSSEWLVVVADGNIEHRRRDLHYCLCLAPFGYRHEFADSLKRTHTCDNHSVVAWLEHIDKRLLLPHWESSAVRKLVARRPWQQSSYFPNDLLLAKWRNEVDCQRSASGQTHGKLRIRNGLGKDNGAPRITGHGYANELRPRVSNWRAKAAFPIGHRKRFAVGQIHAGIREGTSGFRVNDRPRQDGYFLQEHIANLHIAQLPFDTSVSLALEQQSTAAARMAEIHTRHRHALDRPLPGQILASELKIDSRSCRAIRQPRAQRMVLRGSGKIEYGGAGLDRSGCDLPEVRRDPHEIPDSVGRGYGARNLADRLATLLNAERGRRCCNRLHRQKRGDQDRHKLDRPSGPRFTVTDTSFHSLER